MDPTQLAQRLRYHFFLVLPCFAPALLGVDIFPFLVSFSTASLIWSSSPRSRSWPRTAFDAWAWPRGVSLEEAREHAVNGFALTLARKHYFLKKQFMKGPSESVTPAYMGGDIWSIASSTLRAN